MPSEGKKFSRRDFMKQGSHAVAGIAAGALASNSMLAAAPQKGGKMHLGLVTYQWGKDWNLPTLIRNCQKSGVLGVELRTEHAHGVDLPMSDSARYEVKLRFANSPVELVGLGTNWAFHYPDPVRLEKEIESAKGYIKLAHDVGASGVKVKPNALPAEVPVERTIFQIGTALNELGAFGADYGQEVGVEVHGRDTSELPVMKQIFDVATHPNVTVCWNSNDVDLNGKGLKYNFNLVKQRLGKTVHVRELNIGDYPYQELLKLFVQMDYAGWILLEARTEPENRIQAMAEQLTVFNKMIQKSL
jgi:sugar phosphate isomerase/epimerase